MSDVIPENLVALAEQPPTQIYLADGLFVKQIVLRAAGIYVPQHSHRYPHLTMLATGSVRVWEDGECVGNHSAPCGLHIKPGVKHTFLSLEPSVLWCIHRVERCGEVEIETEHQIV